MSGRGNFFAVDRRTWAAVCGLGSINAAVAFLVMARGTLGDMRTTAWSVNAIEDRTGVPRYLAQEAVKRLTEAKFIEKTRGGTRPLYLVAIQPPQPSLPDLTADERFVFNRIAEAAPPVFVPKVGRFDQGWNGGNPYAIAAALIRKGYVRALDGQTFDIIEDEQEQAEPDWIWLPAEIIDGAANETAPVELLRQSQSLSALRLFVDLYHAQSLPRYGGVSWRRLRMLYTKRKVGQQGPHTVWGFTKKHEQTFLGVDFVTPHLGDDPAAPSSQFWSVLRLLTNTGLARFIPHVVEADTDEAAILFPLAVTGGEVEERLVGALAHDASLALLTDWQGRRAEDDGEHLVPLLPHMASAEMVGVLRMRYQAGTEANAGWLRDNRPRWRKAAECFAGLAGKPLPEQVFATSNRDQSDFNSGSTRDQIQG